MKIERIADNAINIYISSKDLASRNLEVSALKEGTHDLDKLIWDAIDHANIEFGHEFEDRQLNVVNKPDGKGGLILMISHDIDEDYEDNFYYCCARWYWEVLPSKSTMSISGKRTDTLYDRS